MDMQSYIPIFLQSSVGQNDLFVSKLVNRMNKVIANIIIFPQYLIQ